MTTQPPLDETALEAAYAAFVKSDRLLEAAYAAFVKSGGKHEDCTELEYDLKAAITAYLTASGAGGEGDAAAMREAAAAVVRRHQDIVGWQPRDNRNGLLQEIEDKILALPCPQASEDGPSKGACLDCGRKYGDEFGFPDLVIPHDVWEKISPTGDDSGLLCPSCMCRRAHDAGLENIEANFMSGPFCRHAPKAQVADGWKPIESAPKGGTWFLGYIPVSDIFYGNVLIIEGSDDGRFYHHAGDDTKAVSPSHWMLLPASPSPDRKGGE